MKVVASSSRARILGECSTIHSPPALFFFFFEVETRSNTLIPLLTPRSDHGGTASEGGDCKCNSRGKQRLVVESSRSADQ